MISKRTFLFCTLAAAACGTSTLLAFPPGHHPPPGMRWCSKCDGDGYNRTWYGYAKKCHICNGTGLLPLAPPPSGYGAPAPHAGGPAHGHGGPAPHAGGPTHGQGGPAPRAGAPAPSYGNGPKGKPQGGSGKPQGGKPGKGPGPQGGNPGKGPAR